MTENNRDEFDYVSSSATNDMDSLRQRVADVDESWSVDRWVEEEKKRLWLGYFSIKL